MGAEAPQIVGTIWTGDQTNCVSAKFHTPTGAFYTRSGAASYTGKTASVDTTWGFGFDAKQCWAGYKRTDGIILPNRYPTRFMIKYI